jgi:predicted P-loop ATPase
VQADYILVLHGKQSRGKSTGMAALCPDPSYFSDCLPADIASKDARQHLSGLWLVELQELTQRKADQNAFKAFISSRVDKFRLPYARTEVELVRKCVFVATVNESEFVTDRSGGRRFWPAEVCLAESDVPGVVPAIRAERDQVWAEARVRAERGERAHLTPAQEQEAAEAMVEHVDNPFEQVLAERLQDALDRPVPGLAYWQYAPGQVVQALTLDQACRLTGVEHAKVWAIIRAFKLLGWQRKRREDKAKAKTRYWARPETEVQELAHVVVNYQS